VSDTTPEPTDRTPGARERLAQLEQLPLTTVGPDPGFVGGLRSAVLGIREYRELLVLLVRRELKARYKDSALGFAWSLLRPLTMLLVYYVAIGRFLGAERAIPDFAVYVFTGLTAWFLFQEIVSAGTGSIVGNAGLIKKVYLPREVFPLAAVGSALFNFATQLVILVAAVAMTGLLRFDGRWVWAPVSVLVLLAWGLGLALLLSAINVYLRDVQYLVEIVLMVMFWASPIVYSWEFVENALPEWAQQVYLANPVTAAVLGMQRTFYTTGDTMPFPEDHMARLLVMLVLGLVLVVVGQRVFARLQANFAQEL
jgi:ABC-2 type transport system permease protein